MELIDNTEKLQKL